MDEIEEGEIADDDQKEPMEISIQKQKRKRDIDVNENENENEKFENENRHPIKKKKRRRMEKKLKNSIKNNTGPKELYFKALGPTAKAVLQIKLKEFLKHGKTGLKLKDIQELILYSLTGCQEPKWITIRNKPLLEQVVVIMIPGIDSVLYNEYSSLMPTFTSIFSPSYPTKAPGDKHRIYSPVQVLLNVSLSNSQKANRKISEKEQPTVIQQYFAEQFVLSPQQLMENEYPTLELLQKQSPKHEFISTQPSTNKKKYKMLSLDCEMCYTVNGLELTRCSLIDEELNTIYDTYCIPSTPILNYNTQYSGITAETLKDVKYSLSNIQKDILNLVDENVILIGHDLKHDLRVFKNHPFTYY